MLTKVKNSLFFVVLTGFLLIGQVTATDTVSQKLLTQYWSTTQGKAANQYYAGEKDRTPESLYAFALVKTRQHDVSMALKSIEVLQKKNPMHTDALRLKVWLQLRQDKYESAMVTLVEFIELIDSKKDTSKLKRQEAVSFAGRIFGFLTGPVGTKVNASNRDAALGEVLSILTDAEQKEFEKGYAMVFNKFRSLMHEKNQVDTEAAVQDAVIQQAKYQALDAREKQLEAAEQRTNLERQRTREQINRGLTDIARTDLAFANQPTIIVPGVVRQHNHYPIYTSGSSTHKHHAPVVGHAVHRPVVYFRKSTHDLHGRRQVLARHYAQLRDLGAGQMNSLNKELKEIKKSKSRTMAQKLRALRPSGKIVTHSVALKTKARSIMTYEQFPLEIEKELVLSSTR